MVKPAKIEKVQKLKELISQSQGVFFFDYSGLATQEIQELKGKLKEAGASFSVVKNTLLSKADENIKLEGPTAALFSAADPLGPLKILFSFLSPKERFVPKAGLFENTLIDAEKVKLLATLPSKEVLYARLAAQLKSPLYKLHGTLEHPLTKLVFVLKAKGGEAPSGM